MPDRMTSRSFNRTRCWSCGQVHGVEGTN
jgi:hypothetical protein